MSNLFKKPQYIVSSMYLTAAADLVFALEENATGVFKCVKNTKGIQNIEYVDARTINDLLKEKHMKILVLSELKEVAHLKDKKRTMIARNWI